MIALTNIAGHFKIKLNAPLITLKIMHFKSSPSGAVALQWQHWSICLDFPCRSNLWVSLSHHLIKGHLQLGCLSSLSRHLNVKVPRERKTRVNVLVHGVINWSECVDNYTQVGKSKRFGEKSLALNSLDKEMFELVFFQENQITATNYCSLQGKNNSWITHARLQKSGALISSPRRRCALSMFFAEKWRL